jgi:hypothetical protein
MLQSYSGGAPAGYSGSPVDNQTCAQSSCHDGGTPIPVTGWIDTSIPEEGFKPDSTYQIVLSAAHLGASRFGFCLSAQDLFGNQVGELIGSSGTQLRGAGKYITHVSSSIAAVDTNSWIFSWTAPSIPIDSVSFYCSFNAANGDGQTSGDVIYTSSKTCFQYGEVTSSSIDIASNNAFFYNRSAQKIQIDKFVGQQFQVFAMGGRVVQQGILSEEINTANFLPGCYVLVIPTNITTRYQSIFKFVVSQ